MDQCVDDIKIPFPLVYFILIGSEVCLVRKERALNRGLETTKKNFLHGEGHIQ